MRNVSIRENMLVTMGARAGSMECLGYITLPAGAAGEDKLAAFVCETVTDYLNSDGDVGFDEYIETALTKKYGRDKTCRECWNWKCCGLSHGRGIGNCKVRGTVENYDTPACESFYNGKGA